MKHEVLVTGPIYPPSMERLDREFATHKLFQASDRNAMIAELAPRIRAVAGSGRADSALINALPKLEIISNFGVGYDNVEVAAAVARKVMVTNTPDVLNDAVADTTLSLILALERRVVAGDRFVRAGKWLKGSLPLTRHLGDLKLGIIGLGRIGKEIAKRALAFDMTVQYHNRRKVPDVPFAYFPSVLELAKASDVLVCITPGGQETYHMINDAVLEALGPTGTVINMARGSVLDEQALIKRLRDRTIGGAAIDVFKEEPKVPEELFAFENVVVAPHLGSATHSTRTKMGNLVVDNLIAHFAGKPVLTPIPECVVARG